MYEDQGSIVGQRRIGEFSRRVGVEAELLRSWERRYGLLAPSRTAGGLRLYGEADERRVARMLEHLRAGVSAAEAARLTCRELPDALSGPALSGPSVPVPAGNAAAAVAGGADVQLCSALDRLDETVANSALDRLIAAFSLETVIRDTVLPYMRELGERWLRTGSASIGQEHFASALLRGRLLGLARGWQDGYGPMAILACLPGDQHDLGLICFGLALRAQGWRITFLGADTPFSTVADTARSLQAGLVVLTASCQRDQDADHDDLAAIAAHAPLALAGAGVTEHAATAAGASLLAGDPFTAAAAVSTALSAQGRAPGNPPASSHATWPSPAG